MHTINFTNNLKNFPLSTQALEFMKLISQQAYQLASLGGSNYILSGCINTSANNWSDGWIVINGELLPFVASSGTLTSNVHVVEVKEAITAGYETYDDVYVSRHVEFGSNVGGADTFVWNTLTRVKSNLELAAESATKEELTALSNLMMPKGGIIMWSGAIVSIPVGYNLCNGATVEGFGVVPDLRSRFIVGYDERTLNNPPNVTDTTINYAGIGNTGGKPTVTLAKDQIPMHSHLMVDPESINGSSPSELSGNNYLLQANLGDVQGDDNNAYALKGTNNLPTVGNTSSVGSGSAHENRPPYYVLAFIIKVV